MYVSIPHLSLRSPHLFRPVDSASHRSTVDASHLPESPFSVFRRSHSYRALCRIPALKALLPKLMVRRRSHHFKVPRTNALSSLNTSRRFFNRLRSPPQRTHASPRRLLPNHPQAQCADLPGREGQRGGRGPRR